VRSAPLGTPRTASCIRGSGCRSRAGARFLLAGDNTFQDGLGSIHYCRLGDLPRVVYDDTQGGQSKETDSRGRTVAESQPETARTVCGRTEQRRPQGSKRCETKVIMV